MARSRSRSKRWKPNRSKSLPKSCFLGSDYTYPICPAGKRRPSCQGIIAAYTRAAAVAGRSRRHGTRGGARARRVMRKASALRRRHGCSHKWNRFGSHKHSSHKRKSHKKSRSRRCKYGELKTPVSTPKGGKRYCRKSRGPHRKKAHRKSRKKSRSRRCKHGKLKTPVRTPSGGKRYCKKKRSRSRK